MIKLDKEYSTIEDSIGNLVLKNDETDIFVLILDTDMKEVVTFSGVSEKDVTNMNEVTSEYLGKKYFYYEDDAVKYRVGGLSNG